MHPPTHSSWQRWLFAALVAGFLWVLASRFAEIQQLLGTLAQGQWEWIGLAAVLQFAYFVAYAALFRAAFSLVDIPAKVRDLLPITFASLFVSATAPSAGTAGLALFIDDARRRGHSAAAAAVSMMLVQGVNFGVFLLILSLGLALLFRRHNLTALEMVSASVVFLMVGGLALALALGSWRPAWLLWLFSKTAGGVNGMGKLLKRPFLLPEEWAAKNAGEFTRAAEAIRTHPARLGVALLIALGMHLISLGSLFSLFLAFHQQPAAITLIVGYAMTILFMLVSPTPSGIGVVEVVVPIIYTSLGMPAAAGTAITLSFRGLSFWLPMLAGFILLRQLRMFSSSERALAESGQVRLIAILTALMGVLNVLSVIRPELLTHLTLITRYAPVAIGRNGAITAILTGFALLILAYGLWRHKQMAWLLTLLVLAVSVITHLLKQSYTEAVLALLLIAYLIAQRSHFHALSDEPSVWQGVRVLAAALGFTLFYGVTGFYVLAQVSDAPFNLGEAWQTTLRFFTISEEPGLFQLNTPFDYLAGSIYVVGAITFGFALFMLLRPVLVQAPASEQERQRAREIVGRYGRSPLTHLLLLPGKSYFFSEGGSVVAFSLFRRTAVALGDAAGPPEGAEAAVQEFLAYCRRRDWRAAFYRTPPESLPRYREAGLQAILIGRELAVDLAGWVPPEETAGGEWQTAVQRPGGEWQTAVHLPPHSQEFIERLRLVSDAWLSEQRREESRFAHGWFSRRYLNNGVLLTLSRPGQDILAFVQALPTQTEGETAVSLLRYRESAAGGHSHLLDALVRWAQRQGYDRLHLGLFPLPAQAREENPARERMGRMIFRAMEPPAWQVDAPALGQTYPLSASPRYLIYPGSTSLPAVWSALNRAGGGGGLWSQVQALAGRFQSFASTT